MSKRRISNIVGNVEYKPGKYRQISNIVGNVEYKPGKYHQISNIALLVEYEPYESMVQNSLNSAADAIRNALYANPNADISSLVASYKSAIEAAFGMTFTVEGGDEWVFISLHFARQGLEAVARAFESWAEGKAASQGLNIPIDRFDLFKRVYGSFAIKNVAEMHDDRVALTVAPNIVVYKQTDGDQWYMTPNNLVHELGHLFDGKAGFGFKRLGSIQYSIDDLGKGGGSSLHDGYSRKGMAEGLDYLRERFLEHAQIQNAGNNVASYTAIDDPFPSDPAYSSFVPQRYLFYEIAYNRFDVWQSPVYTDRYGGNTRIDTLVQNETADATETTADAFLNWVRHWERPTFVNKSGESQAAGWVNFFATNMGMFLRNAVIYRLGMVQHYQSQGSIPQSPLDVGDVDNGEVFVRLTPDDSNNNNAIGDAFGLLPETVEIFGWVDVPTPSEELPYWLLVRGNNDRLVWITAAAIGHNETTVTSNPQTNFQPLAPDRNYTNSDLQTILGV